jgi:hypothetical protein
MRFPPKPIARRLPPLALLVLTACTLIGPGIPPTPAPTIQFTLLPASNPTPTSTPTTTPPPPSTSSPIPALQPDGRPLSANGPWLLLATALDGRTVDGLWALNADGTGLTQLVGDTIIAGPDEFGAAISPTGRHVAYITADDTLWHGLTLHLLSLPDGESEVITALTSAQTEPPPDTPGVNDPAYAPLHAIAGLGRSLAWSPDGRRLAFVGAHEGPSADLYVYSPDDGSITRLSDEPGQAMHPYWSPDGTAILYASYTSILVGRFAMAGVWAAAADGSGVTSLYDPNDPTPSDEEQFVAWVDDGAFMVYSRDPDCGWRDLRTVDVTTGAARSLWPAYFNRMAFDHETGTVLVSVDPYTVVCNESGTAGIFRLTLTDPTPVPVADFAPTTLARAWDGMFYAVTHEAAVYRITPGGEVSELAAPTAFVPVISPDRAYWAWTGQTPKFVGGLWVGPIDGEPVPAFEGAVQVAIWSPDGARLFFIGDNALYLLDRGADEYDPQLIAQGVILRDLRGAAWAAP